MIHKRRSRPHRAPVRRRHAVHPHHDAASPDDQPRPAAHRHDEALAAMMTTTAANLHRNQCPQAPEHRPEDRPAVSRSASSWVAVNSRSMTAEEWTRNLGQEPFEQTCPAGIKP
jgi:hypothetical protein